MKLLPPTPEEIRRELDQLKEESKLKSKKPKDVLLMDYQTEYLKSTLWRKIKERILARDKKQCVYCGGVAEVVHHRSYSREVLEGNADLMLVSLCNACHDFIHFDSSGQGRAPEESDRILIYEQPPRDFPEPSVDLRRDRHSNKPAEWPRMNDIQRRGWLARYQELYAARRAVLKAKAETRAKRHHV
jgi:hypothetical protein